MNFSFDNVPPDSPEEDRLVGSFLRQRGNNYLRERYAKKLETLHGISVGTPNTYTSVRQLFAMRPLLRYIAAVAAIIGIAIPAYFLSQPTSASDQLLAEYLGVEDYYIPISRSTIPRGEEDRVSRSDIQLLLDYGAGHFERVTARAGSPLSHTGTFYVALALIVTNREEEAIRQLAPLTQEGEYMDEAFWHTSLLQLRLGDVAAARKGLESYKPGDSYYHKAQALLSLLEK
jgi:hypothetical protein